MDCQKVWFWKFASNTPCELHLERFHVVLSPQIRPKRRSKGGSANHGFHSKHCKLQVFCRLHCLLLLTDTFYNQSLSLTACISKFMLFILFQADIWTSCTFKSTDFVRDILQKLHFRTKRIYGLEKNTPETISARNKGPNETRRTVPWGVQESWFRSFRCFQAHLEPAYSLGPFWTCFQPSSWQILISKPTIFCWNHASRYLPDGGTVAEQARRAIG